MLQFGSLHSITRILVVASVFVLSACSSISSANRDLPPYARASENYRSFIDADALGAYLRYDGPAGPMVSAHRGGPERAYPENALATFERTMRHSPAFVECDIRVSQDGELVMVHDSTLERTTTGTGYVASHTMQQLRGLLLKDDYGVITPFRIPTLDEALSWSEARTVLMLDIKKGIPAADVIRQIRKHEASNRVVLIMYTYEQLDEYLKLAPGFVYSVPAVTDEDVDALEASGLSLDRAIGWLGVGEFDPAILDRLHRLNIKGMLGTFGEIDERAEKAGEAVYLQLLESGVDVIASDNAGVVVRATSSFGKFAR